ncbi:unnamed protein product [Umbelopsis ramanniana]
MTKRTSFRPWPSHQHTEIGSVRNKSVELASSHIENAGSGCTKYGQLLKRYGKRLILSSSGRSNTPRRVHLEESKEANVHRKPNLFSRWSCCSFGLGNHMHDGDRSTEPQQTIFQNNNATSSQTATSFTDLSSKLSELEKRDVDSVSIEATLNNSRQHISLSEKGPRTDESVVAEDETVAPSDGSAGQTVATSTTAESEPSVIDKREDGPDNGQETLPDPRSPASTLLSVPPIVATNFIPPQHEQTVHYDALHYPHRQHAWLLSALAPEDQGKKCLVLDLDETLVHSSFKATQQADMIVPVEIDGTVHNVYVLKRPGVDNFMKRMSSIYEIVVFTASLSKYADPVLDVLDIHRVVQHRLFRESCFNHMGTYVKDLSQLGRNVTEVIILDNSPASYLFHPANAVPVSSWFNDPHDSELIDMIPFLEELATVRDVTAVLDNILANTL